MCNGLGGAGGGGYTPAGLARGDYSISLPDYGSTGQMQRGRISDQKEAEAIADSQAAAARRKRRGKRRFRNTTADAGTTGLNIPASGSSVNIPS